MTGTRHTNLGESILLRWVWAATAGSVFFPGSGSGGIICGTPAGL